MNTNSVLSVVSDGFGGFSMTADVLVGEVKRLWAAHRRAVQERAMARRIADELALFGIDDLLDMGYGRDDIAELARETARLHFQNAG